MSDVIVVEAVWPHDYKNAHIQYLSDQQIQLSAINRSAVLTLAANKQHFTVRYLVQIRKLYIIVNMFSSEMQSGNCYNCTIKLCYVTIFFILIDSIFIFKFDTSPPH